MQLRSLNGTGCQYLSIRLRSEYTHDEIAPDLAE
jgi:hypothetical protein